MSIPLPRLLREHRRQTFIKSLQSPQSRYGLGLWAAMAKRPGLYQLLTGIGVRVLARLGKARGKFKRLPLAGAWTKGRDLPVPQGPSTFMQQYRSSAHAKRNGRIA